MTTQLSERLQALADEAPPTLHARDLWQAGRRRRRRRNLSVAAVVGCLVAASAALGIGDWQSRQPDPASPSPSGGARMSLPDRLFNPSPWTPSTSTPGRLVVLMTARRDHFPFGSDDNALAGVSPDSQAYHFLDGLTGQSTSATDVALAPDGRHLAYWVSGTTRGALSVGSGSITGIGILDLGTGAVQRFDVSSAHGLAPMAALTWTDDKTVAMTTDRYTSARVNSWSGRSTVRLVTLGRTTPEVLPHSNVDQVVVTSVGGYAGMVATHVLRSYDASGRQRPDLRVSDPVKSLAYDAPLGLVAATKGDLNRGGSTQGKLVVGRAAHGHVHLTSVPGGRRYYQALAWVDPTHVTTMRLTRTGLVYDVVDVTTGARHQLTRKPWYAFQVASDALRDPAVVPGVAPPQPWNPRWIAGGVIGVVLVAGVGGLALRRSRARG